MNRLVDEVAQLVLQYGRMTGLGNEYATAQAVTARILSEAAKVARDEACFGYAEAYKVGAKMASENIATAIERLGDS